MITVPCSVCTKYPARYMLLAAFAERVVKRLCMYCYREWYDNQNFPS